MRALRLMCWLGLAVAMGACDPRPPSDPSSGPSAAGPIAAPAPAAFPPSAMAPTWLPPDGSWFDPQAIPQLLDDPRLAVVRAALLPNGGAGANASAGTDAERAARAASAAKLLDAALAADLHPLERAEWSFQLGLLYEQGGQSGLATRAYDKAAEAARSLGDGGPLRPYALHAAGRLLAQAGEPQKALAHFDAIDPTVPIALDVDRADAYVKLGDLDRAAALYRAYLDRSPRPRDWTDVGLRFAKALVNKPGAKYAEEAAQRALAIDVSSSGGRGSGEAQAILNDAKALLPHDRQLALESPPPSELAGRALSLATSGQHKRALAVADRVLVATAGAVIPDEVACVALRARGKALDSLRRREESLVAYEEAVEKCAAHADLPQVMYETGRVGQRASRNDAAATAFEALETRFPDHRLADDARLQRAEVLRSMGEGVRAAALLSSMPTDFPKGDMIGDGLFMLALQHVELGDWRGALEPLRRGAALGLERVYYRAGRFPYFMGRAQLETGDRAGAIETWKRLVREQPLTYYMAMAYARLEELAPGTARAAAAEGMAAPPEPRFLVARTDVIGSPAFARAIALSRQGAEELAVVELDALGLRDGSASPEVAYASAFLLTAAGSIQRSHAIFRASTMPTSGAEAPIVDWLDHYPVGKWRPVWEIAFPRPYFDVVSAESTRSGVPVALIYAIMREESAFAPRVVSAADAYGLMQLIVPTAKQMAAPLGLSYDAESLKEPTTNIALGSRFLSVLRRRFDDNPALAIPGYNAGPGAPEKWLKERPTDTFDLWVERIPYGETRLYTKRVLTSLVAYELLYGGGLEGEAFRLPRLASERAAAGAAEASTAGL